MQQLYVPKKYQGVYAKAMSGKSLKASIRAHCLMCLGWDPEGVRGCTGTWCPLFPHRLGYNPRDRVTKKADLDQSHWFKASEN